MRDSETLLVERAREGDREAFAALVEAHWDRLVRLARSVVGEAESEDLVQDGLLVAWRKLGGLTEPSAFSSWVTRVVLRLCLRRTRFRRPWIPLDRVPEPTADSDPGTRIDVERLLGSLAPRQRAVIHLTAVEGMADSEIAALLGISPAGVRSHRRRARERLTHRLSGPEKGTRR